MGGDAGLVADLAERQRRAGLLREPDPGRRLGGPDRRAQASGTGRFDASDLMPAGGRFGQLLDRHGASTCRTGPDSLQTGPRRTSRTAGRRVARATGSSDERRGAAARPAAPRLRARPRGGSSLDERAGAAHRSRATATLDGAAVRPQALVALVVRLLVAAGDPGRGLRRPVATFDFLRDAGREPPAWSSASRSSSGVGGVFFLFWAMNRVVDLLPERVPRRRPALRLRRAGARDPRACSSSTR